MVKIDLSGLVEETELTFSRFAKKLDVTTKTIFNSRVSGEVSEKLAFKLMDVFPKLYKKYRG